MNCICGSDVGSVSFVGEVACPCGLIWHYDEGSRPTDDSIKTAIRLAVERERDACAQIAEQYEDAATEIRSRSDDTYISADVPKTV